MVETKSKLAELEQQLKDIVDAKKLLQVQNIDLLSEVDSLKIEKESLESEMKSNLSEKKSQLDSDADKLIEEIKAKEANILESQEINRQLNENLVEWQNSNAAIEQQILLLQQQNSILVDQLNQEPTNTIHETKSEQVLSQSKKSIDMDPQLVQNNLELNTKLETLSAIVSTFQEERLISENKSEALKQEIEHLNSALSQSQDNSKSLAGLEEENLALKKKIDDLEHEVRILNENLVSEKEHVETLRSDLNSNNLF